MSIDLSDRPDTRRMGWLGTWFGRHVPVAAPAFRSSESKPGHRSVTGVEAVQGFVDELISRDRYAFVLLKSAADHVEDEVTGLAWKAIKAQMALVPGGLLPIVRGNGAEEVDEVAPFYLDRQAVTNRQFERFVASGGYDDLEIWPREIWPSVLRFTDRTGRPGPSGWSDGRFPAGKADHPAVGICWHEAAAYARWVGKRLPTAAEWQKAGGWPEQLGGGTCTRYPWGDLFDPSRANLWASGLGATTPVTAFRNGDTLNGIHQMTGNVWEWLDDVLDTIPCRHGTTFQSWRPMRRIIGGAFDTYLPSEATCHFVTGQEELDRRDNIGFRCALSIDRLRPTPCPS